MELSSIMSEFTPEERHKIRVVENSSTASHLHLRRMSVGMIDIGYDEYPFSSGTLIDMYGHLLIATAAHCIPSDPNRRLWILSDLPRKAEDGLLGLVWHQRNPVVDVGFVEISAADAKDYFSDKAYCSPERLSTDCPVTDSVLVTLVGNPARRAAADHKTRTLAAKCDAYASGTIPMNQWPIVPSTERPSDCTTDLFLDYPEQLHNIQLSATIDAFSPVGFSGGGVWSQNLAKERMWSPEAATLIAIQSSWQERLGYLRATQVIHWLQLVWRSYPDIRPQIEKQFSQVTFEA